MRTTHSTHSSMTIWCRPALSVALGLGVVSLGVVPAPREGRAQEQPRLNKVIEALEAGRPAIANQEWRFVDMEHSPFSGERLQSVLAEMNQDRDADGRMTLTPFVRIPQEGDEDFKWAIKQALDLGWFGIIVPHVDTKEEAVRLVQAMRYPPPLNSAQPEPRGERGWGPGGAMRLWGMDGAEYHRKADVWPLNPAGELFAVAMIESAEAVRNIHEILEAPISAILVAAADMAVDLGLGPNPAGGNYPEVEAAFQTVLEACLAQNRVICGRTASRSRLQERLDAGWRFVTASEGVPYQSP
jgi:4-hydroxy-2-oxoheptanedioate aldolase